MGTPTSADVLVSGTGSFVQRRASGACSHPCDQNRTTAPFGCCPQSFASPHWQFAAAPQVSSVVGTQPVVKPPPTWSQRARRGSLG
jgi:hypothetical protein